MSFPAPVEPPMTATNKLGTIAKQRVNIFRIHGPVVNQEIPKRRKWFIGGKIETSQGNVASKWTLCKWTLAELRKTVELRAREGHMLLLVYLIKDMTLTDWQVSYVEHKNTQHNGSW